MFTHCKKVTCTVSSIIILILLGWAFGLPATMLAKKSPLAEASYTLGWEHGCKSGISAMAPLRPLFSHTPFLRDEKTVASDSYKNGWNEGYTSCRFFQSAWFDVFALALLVLTLIATRCRCGKGQ